MKSAAKFLATFFGIGLFPTAPGTLASAVAALVFMFALHGLAWPLYLLLLALLFLAGTAASAVHAAELGNPDPGRIVIDEVCGQLLALAFLPAAWVPVTVSFVLFRIFDIIKPWPIRRLEKLPGGWGIMVDDIGAGLAAAALSRLVLLLI